MLRATDLREDALLPDAWLAYGRVLPSFWKEGRPYRNYFMLRLPSYEYKLGYYGRKPQWHQRVLFWSGYPDGCKHLDGPMSGWQIFSVSVEELPCL